MDDIQIYKMLLSKAFTYIAIMVPDSEEEFNECSNEAKSFWLEVGQWMKETHAMLCSEHPEVVELLRRASNASSN